MPVILLTARGEIAEKVEGLDLGADDYLPKPFSIDELAARVRGLLRRNSGENLVCYRVEDLTLDLATRIVRRGGRRIELTTREFSLLECLMRAPGRVFTLTQLFTALLRCGSRCRRPSEHLPCVEPAEYEHRPNYSPDRNDIAQTGWQSWRRNLFSSSITKIRVQTSFILGKG